ncbi:sensor histidine kinase [Arthrobacter sp. L77]|uniref:sensor histidine kinase n=1 Tax=Arthrobacter sp. L77 TaxID=1496689 RepID=UPI0018CFBE0B|nr:histidine kinase [Arthrobacter sp. L77]
MNPPRRVWRDGALVAVLLAWSVVETVLREDLGSRPLVLAIVCVVLAPLWWRRTHPLAAVAISFGILTAVDVARIIGGEEAGLLTSISGVLVLTYALFRWGAGREAATGLGIILVWLVITHVADLTSPADTVAAFGFFLFAAALGAAIRYHAHTRTRDLDEAKAREREQLARDLHDTVAHHVSGIVIQAQAGRAVATSYPERATEVLAVIEDAASRTLTELRTMVGVLRASEGADFAPPPGVAELGRLAGRAEGGPQVEVELTGELDDLSPAVGAALYRLTQESVTNARRHARDATRVAVRVVGDAERVQLTVDDDGAVGAAGGSPSGYGLIGMRERAKMLGGTFHAGPRADGGWRVEATLPRAGAPR